MPGRTRRLPALGVVLLAAGCATARLPPPETMAAARAASCYSASVRFSISGPDLRGRGRALVAFERPDRLRVEVPGATGVLLVAVVRGGSLTAVFPADRAVFSDAATAAALDALFGLSLTPPEVMDILIGASPPTLRAYETKWGPSLPKAVHAVLSDGTRLKLDIETPERDGPIPEAAFVPPPHEGYRAVDAAQARALWSPR